MARYNVPLAAGAQLRLPYFGTVLRLMAVSGAKDVDVTLEFGSQQNPQAFGSMREGGKLKAPTRFTGILLEADTECIVDLLVTDIDVEMETPNTGGTTVNAAITRGPFSVDDTETDLVASDSNRLSITFCNRDDSTDAVAIVPPGGDWGTRSVVLQPGDTVEFSTEDGAHLAWSGICDTGNAATVTTRELYA